MKVLVLNCGSSSIKFQLLEMTTQDVIVKGIVEKIGLKGSFLKSKRFDGDQIKLEGEILDHQIGIEYILGVLVSDEHGAIKSLDEIGSVGHRVAHGGEFFKASAYLSEDAIGKIEKCAELAPLHNPANLKGIYAIKSLIPNIKQVAVFDTSFHQTMPAHAYMYGIPRALYEKYGIRRYGFHGTSHRYVAEQTCEMLGTKMEEQKIVTCHLGNGASVAAIDKGQSIDTSMGFTPLEGLIMGTRCGDLDIGAFMFIMEKEEIGLPSANTLVNKHSGMVGLTGVSSDMRTIEEAAEKGDERCINALKAYDYRIKKYIGAYTAAMNGIDTLIFTGGIGENADVTRAGVANDLEYLGIKIDPEKNNGLRGEPAVISTDDSKVKVVVMPTNEELVIAIDTLRIVKEM
ncbi:MAG: acetate kinase [Salinivirgaceae bacterium]|jgi:acetate kinase|nr:acetate kinase [Salinivirgaceae bacterium]